MLLAILVRYFFILHNDDERSSSIRTFIFRSMGLLVAVLTARFLIQYRLLKLYSDLHFIFGDDVFSFCELNEIVIIGAFLLSASVIFVANWLALIPWRRNRDKHWSEQARLVFPVVVAARSQLWVVPAILVLIVVLIWPDSSPLWVFTGLAAVLGAYLGTFPLDREVFPRISLPYLLRQTLIGVLLRSLIRIIFLGAIIFMPNEFNFTAWAIFGAVLCLWVLWTRGALIFLGRKFNLFQPAPARLQKIADDVSQKMNIPFREVLLIRAPVAQAFALFSGRRLAFTERLLEIAPDDEVAAICAHELAHLAESKTARYARSIAGLTFLPWVFFKPLTHAFGMLAFFGLLFITIGVPRLCGKLSRRLETRADQMATAQEGDSGTYARALTRLYQDGLLPAVSAKNRASHPDLYDRLLASGVTPDFPRPAPAATMAPHGHIFAGLAGLLFALFAMRLMHAFHAAAN
jgi:Zn-dependent protease with chaperone function